jgi:hypothetical protein
MQRFLSLRLFKAIVFLVAALPLFAIGPARAQTYGSGLVADGSVNFTNRSARPLYVAFSVAPGRPGPVVWSAGCQRFNEQVRLAPGESCVASVPASAGPARFCAAENPEPAGKTPNCYDAQKRNQTIIETNFANGQGCRPTTQNSCVWYDVSIIPESCTNCGWLANNCKDSGGVSYNVPVQLSCRSAPSFTCRGPVAPLGVYGVKFPTNCGTPFNQPNCIGGLNGACLQAYFYPMSTSGACAYPTSKPQPNGQCQQGETLYATFLDGP